MRKFKEHNTDDGKGVETNQDVTDIIEKNKQEYKNRSTKWGEDVRDNKIASIPLTVIDKLNQQGIMRGFHGLIPKEILCMVKRPRQ